MLLHMSFIEGGYMSLNRFSNPNLLELPDCVALSEYEKCNRLTLLICNKCGCPFKKTREEDLASIQRAYQRLASLNDSTQNRIAQKYYGGYMPWNKK